MSKKNIITKEFLEREYIQEDRTLKDIAIELGCSRSTVGNRIKEFGIKLRSNKKYNITKEFLEKEYIQKDRTGRDIADELKFPLWAIERILKKFGIRKRFPKEKHVNKKILCACGCGKRRWKYNKYGNKCRFIRGHFGKTKIIKVDRDTLVSLYKKHHSFQKIAEELGYSISFINTLFKRNNINHLDISSQWIGSESNMRLNLKDIKVINYWKSNKISILGLSKIFSCSEITISKILKRNNIKSYKNGYFQKGKTPPNKLKLPENEIIRLYKVKKMNCKEIGKKFNCSIRQISEVLRKNGITIRRRKNKSFEEYFGEEKAYKMKKGIKLARAKQIVPQKDTKIELRIQDFLTALKIEFITHKYMNIKHSYQCDILVPSMNLVIECDGDYFHMNPSEFFPNDRIFKNGMTAKEKWKLDSTRTKELLEKGYNVIRLWENKINKMNLNDFNEILALSTIQTT